MVTDKELIIHEMRFTANYTETGSGVVSWEERKSLNKNAIEKQLCEKDREYVARLRSIADNL